MDLRELIEKLSEAKGYLVTATLLDNNEMLTHYISVDNFPVADLLKSHKKTKDLVIEAAEEDVETETF